MTPPEGRNNSHPGSTIPQWSITTLSNQRNAEEEDTHNESLPCTRGKSTTHDRRFHKKHSQPNTYSTHQTTICKSTQGAKNEANHPSHGDTRSPTSTTEKLRNEQRDNLANTAARPWGEPPPKRAKSRPGRTSPERSPNKRHTSDHRGNTTVARNEHRALLGRTSTRSDKGRSWEEPSPECTTQTTKQHKPSEKTLQQAELHKQRKQVLGELPPEPPRHHSRKTRQNALAKPTAHLRL
ncbi:hypothetical protein Taro_042679 [Colocasia esculenta]|uniref:Uncharacterized protein n=1 Tax=Colocasia esculenta TaxID=4460 RepID=A0A843WTH5_COLES|nr:hypothetical protein [Colocasia esculenta]